VSEDIKNQSIGSSVPGFNLGQLKSIRLRIPPLATQRAIAHILGSLDDKIELNRRMNETLESMARALFQSWFVDFDPVRAKAEGRKPAGMDDETARLFPSEFVESELGPVPRGWRVENLGAVVDLQRGNTYQSALKGTIGPYLIGLNAIERNGGFRGDKLVRYSGECPDKLLLYPGDLFVSLKDVTQAADLLGAVARIPSYIELGRLTQDTVKLVITREVPLSRLLYRVLLTPEYRGYCRAHATGTTNLGLSRDDFFAYPLVVPNRGVLDLFNTNISALESRIEATLVENRRLGVVRDALLPRLLSGELPVDDAERFASKAV
jgi:type I restriction enzyme S subunit